ncbi:BQ2448_1985 [Microbotryum intermedium]|uniref:BQ2448_1985 protein n=1 Tax=Microbotryum intermedium TaxID=269621 RepID=A0A238F6Z9_9BASI|nr:BQ2448_1985 [Microbotryum intermedium]
MYSTEPRWEKTEFMDVQVSSSDQEVEASLILRTPKLDTEAKSGSTEVKHGRRAPTSSSNERGWVLDDFGEFVDLSSDWEELSSKLDSAMRTETNNGGDSEGDDTRNGYPMMETTVLEMERSRDVRTEEEFSIDWASAEREGSLARDSPINPTVLSPSIYDICPFRISSYETEASHRRTWRSLSGTGLLSRRQQAIAKMTGRDAGLM